MKKYLIIIFIFLLTSSCRQSIDKEKVKREIVETEKQFEQMCKEKNIAEAFTFFADETAVIKRGNDSLIYGKVKIKNYYTNIIYKNAKVSWKPDFIDVSDCGNLAYSYGNYVWKISNDNTTSEFRGIYTTIWKRQLDNSWKYVWD
ncbi:MAG: nuclear transport factor 2 family protein [Ignavibacteriae bacterium]|nr:nuclear transport factor 2 family protein [Ignavibacteriota bacterium]